MMEEAVVKTELEVEYDELSLDTVKQDIDIGPTQFQRPNKMTFPQLINLASVKCEISSSPSTAVQNDNNSDVQVPVAVLQSVAAKRKNFSPDEVALLLELIGMKYKNTILNKKTNAVGWAQKEAVWEQIMSEFQQQGYGRTKEQLKLKWELLKKLARKRSAVLKRNARRTEGQPLEVIVKDDVLDFVIGILGINCMGSDNSHVDEGTVVTREEANLQDSDEMPVLIETERPDVVELDLKQEDTTESEARPSGCHEDHPYTPAAGSQKSTPTTEQGHRQLVNVRAGPMDETESSQNPENGTECRKVISERLPFSRRVNVKCGLKKITRMSVKKQIEIARLEFYRAQTVLAKEKAALVRLQQIETKKRISNM